MVVLVSLAQVESRVPVSSWAHLTVVRLARLHVHLGGLEVGLGEGWVEVAVGRGLGCRVEVLGVRVDAHGEAGGWHVGPVLLSVHRVLHGVHAAHNLRQHSRLVKIILSTLRLPFTDQF